jgi:pimeloyl-ACP methyl ester carboxylesterase
MPSITNLVSLFKPAVLKKLIAINLLVAALTPQLFCQSEIRLGAEFSSAPTKSGFVSIDLSLGDFVTVRNTRLWVEAQGEGEALVVLGSRLKDVHVSFRPYLLVSAKQFRIISYDYRGNGRSGKSENVNSDIRTDVEDLEALRQKLGLDAICLYGFSYGGLIAETYAREYPAHVAHLIVAKPSLDGPEMFINPRLENQYPEIWEKIQLLFADERIAVDPEMERLSQGVCREYC